jgi:hypothetical protein
MTVPVFQCKQCRHYQGDGKCTAFPGGIPDPILFFEHDHRKPYPGDQGIRFEPKREPLKPR